LYTEIGQYDGKRRRIGWKRRSKWLVSFAV
jgi:hypothetical protein